MHHETIWHIYSWTRLLPFISLLIQFRNDYYTPVFRSLCLSAYADSCPFDNFFCLLWHWFTYLVHGCVTMRGYAVYFYEQCQIYRSFDMTSCPSCSFCLLKNSHTIFGTRVYYRECMCRVHDPDTTLTFRSNLKGFWHDFVFGPQHVCPFTWSYHIWLMSVSPWDNMTYIFLTSVWPWHFSQY